MSRDLVPHKIEVQVVGRRVSNEPVSNDGDIIAMCDTVTYDIVAVESDYAFQMQSVRPHKRPVSRLGSQVDIEAASFGDRGWLLVMPDGELRFSIAESIVFGPCQ